MSAEITEFLYDAGAGYNPFTSGMIVEPGTVLNFRMTWKNTGSSTITARTYLKIINPGGQETLVNPDVYYLPLAPGEYTPVYFDNVGFASVGIYGVEGRLVEQDTGVELDSFSFAVQSGQSGEVQLVSSITPLITLMMTMLLMGVLVKGAKQQ